MTTSKPKDDQSTAKQVDADKAADQGNAEVQSKVDEAEEKGYYGWVPDETPNEAYTLKSGPDAPPLVADNRTRNNQSSLPEGDAK